MKISAPKKNQLDVALSPRGRFSRKWLGYSVVVLAVGFLVSTPVRAQLVITASSSAPSAGVFVSQPTENALSDSGLLRFTAPPTSYFGFGQVFTAPSTVTLKSVTVRLDSVGDNSPGILSAWSGQSLTFSVFSTASAASTTLGSSLFSAAAALPSLTSGDYVTFNFSSGVSLTAGAFYAFTILPPSSTVGPDSLFIASYSATTSPYAGGRRLVFNDASYTETGSDANNDVVFYLSTSAIPEPATYAAIVGAIALGVVVARRTRRRQPAA